MTVKVIGAGLAGSEAAWQLANRGFQVALYEMKPEKMTPAHHSPDFAELVCSNSFRGDRLENAVGLLKEELRRCGSLIMACADATRVEAGGCLAVDRQGFSAMVTEKVRSHPNITVIPGEVTGVPEGPVIVATGPLTSDALSDAIGSYFGTEYLHFFDAAAPLIAADSVDMEKAWWQSRYDRGTPDYVNCAMNPQEYADFVRELSTAQEAEVHGFEDANVFEGCMPVEVMARRGADTLEQKRVFSMIPGLEHAEFLRYGVMHRNTFLQSPRLLDRYYADRRDPMVAFAGQMTGVEGYVESTASGFLAAVAMAARLRGTEPPDFPKTTAIGALGLYISDEAVTAFQPMNINFSIIAPLEKRVRKKSEKNAAISARALAAVDELVAAGF